MNIIRLAKKCITRNYCTTRLTKLCFEKLSSRSVIRVSGAESLQFLQGLITNDMNHLQTHSKGMYTMFLNKAGRVMYESIIYRGDKDGTFLVECDQSVRDELMKHLKIFRVRRKIDITRVDDEVAVWSAFPSDSSFEESLNEKTLSSEIIACLDPRVKSFGLRIVATTDLDRDGVAKSIGEGYGCDESSAVSYKLKRYMLGIGEGVSEIIPGKSFPLESNCDYMHGVSFHKGCYLGQEFTARTHHTGVIRKRIMPLVLDEPIVGDSDNLQVKNESDKAAGQIRGVEAKWGIGLMRVHETLEAKQLLVDGIKCSASQPFWWPKETPPAPEKSSN